MFFNKIGKNNKKRVSVYFSPEEWSSDTHSKRLNSFVDGLSSDYEYKMIPYYTDYKKTEYIVIHGWKKIYDPGQYREYLIDSHNNSSPLYHSKDWLILVFYLKLYQTAQ